MEIGQVRLVNIEDEMRGAYLDFAMSVITARALPDVRDGLKPVQRRILYAMDGLALHPNTPYKKSARIVGEVLGKYHPHGDAPVYETMVRLAQDFSLRYMLVDGQGNFGSVDGDPPAAMRYSEARLAAIAEEMLADLDKNTVDFAPNFDGSLQEPTVLPAKLPNLLVNGAIGIAVGMATIIPPQNLGEVAGALRWVIERVDACTKSGVPFDLVWARTMNAGVPADEMVRFVDQLTESLRRKLTATVARETRNKAVSTEQLVTALAEYVDNEIDVPADKLLEFIKGPDFPTGGIMLGTEGIKSAYATGHGRIIIRARARIEEMRSGRYQLVITELPYQVNKANLLEKIADLVRDRKIDGISELRDESDRQGMRVVIELRREAQPRLILNQLYKFTAMQTAFSANLLALVDGQPRVLTLKMALLHYLNYRKQVLTRRTEFELGRAKQREHILQGLKIALDHLDAVIQTIRQSRDADEARGALMAKFGLSEVQAQAILDMQLRRLAALERQKVLDELAEVQKLIAHLADLLAHPVRILHLVRDDLKHLVDKYGDERRTQIVLKESEDFSDEDLIPNQDVVIILTKRDYVKRTPNDSYRPRGRGTKGAMATVTREDDAVQHILAARAHDNLLFFTNQGRVYQLKAHQLPESSAQARGTPLINFVRLQAGETVTAVMAVEDFVPGAHCVLVTRRGEIKRVSLQDFSSVRSAGIGAMDLTAGDELGWARLTTGRQHIILASRHGQAIRFPEEEVRASSRGSGGVRAMRLAEGDDLVGADVVEEGGDLLAITQRGFGKRVRLDEFPTHGRGGGGVRALNVTDKTGPVATARVVQAADEVMMISAEGLVVRTAVDGISQLGRAASGVTLMNVDTSDTVAAITRLRGEPTENGKAPASRRTSSEKTVADAISPAGERPAKSSGRSASETSARTPRRAKPEGNGRA
ncbi:MAG: DNA gyrase subunit A [Chloroflexi bacterium]|nr:DNA gyrase subunit A [Chloroflexota bacterium]